MSSLTFKLYSVLAFFIFINGVTGQDTITKDQLKFFESKVRPLFLSKCISCHGPEKQKNKLRLDSRTTMIKGGKNGPAIVPFHPEKSLLIKAINYESLEMPPTKKLSPKAIKTLTQWVKIGAPWPESNPKLIRSKEGNFTDEDRKWWAIQPVRLPQVPKAGNNWDRNEIDHFIQEKLQDSKLTPAREADRYELVRRAYFDLHGLPPTPEQIDKFINDKTNDAWPRLIDELLESPRYGERWAQHWLDVVRFSESDGYREDAFRPGASAYRNYVIRSFNQDKPYDQFVQEQLAGDEIAPDDPTVFIGTSFLRQGVYEWNQRNARMHWDIIVNEVTRVTGEAFLGLGIGCAQCHDHKFDPILQKDYYGLQAFLSSIAWPMDRALASPEEIKAHRKKQTLWESKTKSIRQEMHHLAEAAFQSNQKFTVQQFPEDIQAIYYKPKLKKTSYEKQLSYLVDRQAQRAGRRFDYEKALKNDSEKLKRYLELKDKLNTFDSLKPSPLPKAFIATDISSDPAPTYLYTRTSKTQIQPSYLTLLGLDPPKITPTASSTGRRRALAKWIASKENPLSTRVIVNRLWQRHFGRGIVSTPNDFGTLGEPPSHPELLDWLTHQFLEGGWKMKPIHKLIMMSATYRQTARREPKELERNIDPNNRLLWRFHPQRLDAEQVRDAMLSVSGELQHRQGGPSVAGNSSYRSVYVKKFRNKPDEILKGFDAPLGFESSPDRISTTTPIQSLLLINGPWSLERSRAFAKRLIANKKHISEEDIRKAYQLVYAREAQPREVQAALKFIEQQTNNLNGTNLTKSADPFPNETGLRPISQHFKNIKGFGLGSNALWIQPGSRFEKLHIRETQPLGDVFTVEAIVNLDRIYSNASVNTLISQWNGNKGSMGWSIGITSQRSAYQPRNFIVQLVGRTFQDEPTYEVVASGLRFPLGKPMYIAVTISATTSSKNPTSGEITFYMKDLSDPKAKLESVKVQTSVVSDIQNLKSKLLIGGRDGRGHQWDGQLARLRMSRGILKQDQLLTQKQSLITTPVLDWKFNSPFPPSSKPQSSWVKRELKNNATLPTSKLHRAVTDFCHALFNSNEFLYQH